MSPVPSDSAIAPALELFVDVLAQIDADAVSDDYFTRLAAALCRTTGVRRALMVLYDDARRRVRAVGAHGVPLERLEGRHVSLELAPVARQALGPNVDLVEGDPTRAGPWMEKLDDCDGAVHLAGENIFAKARPNGPVDSASSWFGTTPWITSVDRM